MWRVVTGVAWRVAAILLSVGLVTFIGLTARMLIDGSGVLLHVPAEHDPRLVGTWRTAEEAWDADSYVFRPDGTGELVRKGRSKKMFWGTQADTLFDKHFSTDAWGLSEYKFNVSPDRKTLRLQRGERHDSAQTYKRVP
jgi:hypothetical protein